MKKRIVSLLLALVMVLSLVPTTVWAAENHDGQVRVIVENTTYAKADGAAAFMVGTTEFAVPLGNMIDVEAEIARMEAELKHKEGFLQGVLKKLSNEKFVNNAPAAVIEMERKKQADAESIISSLRESIAALKKA